VDGGWAATGTPWTHDAERYAGIAAARRREQDVMRCYQSGAACLMRTLRRELDDNTESDCGRCAVCTGQLPAPGSSADPATIRAALVHLRSQRVVIEPRKMWPSGASRRGKIPDPLRAEPGRALSRGDDAVWSDPVRAALSRDEPVPAEVFDGVVDVLAAWGWPAGRPAWVSWVPSRRSNTLLRDLAERLAAVGRLAVLDALVADGPGRQSDAETNAESAALALRRLSIGADVAPGPVLLLDDSTRSGFSLTVASALLREAGSGPVYPLVLHKQF
jgi:ATP-dependent DNA helicase RecQ